MVRTRLKKGLKMRLPASTPHRSAVDSTQLGTASTVTSEHNRMPWTPQRLLKQDDVKV